MSLGSYVSSAASIARGLVLAKLLAPLGVGTVAGVGLLLSYSVYADLGISQAVGRQISLSQGEGHPDEARSWPIYALIAQFAGGMLVSLGVLIYVLMQDGSLNSDLQFGLLTAGPAVILVGLAAAQQMALAGSREFGKAALLMSVLSVGNLLSAVGGALAGGVRGVFAGQVLSLAVAVAVGFRLTGRPVVFQPSWRKALGLLRVGFPLAVLTFGSYGLIYLDQAVVLAYLGRESLGLYTVVLYAGAGLNLVPIAVAGVMTPRQIAQFAQHRTMESLEDLTWRPVALLSRGLPVLIALGMILAPVAIRRLLPLYSETIGPLRIYLVGCYFLGLNAGVGSTLVAINKFLRNIPVVLGAICLNLAVDALLVGHLGLGLEGVAAGSAITYACYWLVSSTMVRYCFDPNLGRALVFTLKKAWPGLPPLIYVVVAARSGRLGASSPSLELPLLLSTIFVGLLPRFWRGRSTRY